MVELTNHSWVFSHKVLVKCILGRDSVGRNGARQIDDFSDGHPRFTDCVGDIIAHFPTKSARGCLMKRKAFIFTVEEIWCQCIIPTRIKAGFFKWQTLPSGPARISSYWTVVIANCFGRYTSPITNEAKVRPLKNSFTKILITACWKLL